ncbi:hypothetical protein KO516_05275, partial [Citreicella sp. C3M06]|nr:hypothetical protein [Citreicella sp. C3M06]
RHVGNPPPDNLAMPAAQIDLTDLTRAGFLKSLSAKGPARIGFPLTPGSRLFPSLITDSAPQRISPATDP